MGDSTTNQQTGQTPDPAATPAGTAASGATQDPAAAAASSATEAASSSSTDALSGSTSAEPPSSQSSSAPDPAAPPAPSAAELAQQLADMQRKLAELETAQASAYAGLSSSDAELAKKVEDLRAKFENWPTKDGTYADEAQPWDLQGHELPHPGVTRDHLPGGKPDPISPVVLAHNKPLLTAGSAGDDVAELARLLAGVGYPTSISEGRNHANAFDDTVTAAVNAFRRDFHVQEDPSQWPQDPQAADRFVGPWTWEALIRVAKAAGL